MEGMHIKRTDEMDGRSKLRGVLDTVFEGDGYLHVKAGDKAGDEFGIKVLEMSRDGMRDGMVCVCINRIETVTKNAGAGSRLMEEICRWADLNGVTLTLTPSTDFGATSVSRLERFYRRFGFIPNKGRRSNFVTRQSMYRPVK